MLLKLTENKTVLVIGSVYDGLEKIHNLAELCAKYAFVILNGNVCFPIEGVEKRIDKLQKYLEQFSNLIYINGSKDLELKTKSDDVKVCKWINKNTNLVQLNFANGSNLLVLNGGVLPTMKKKDLRNNLEISFVSKVGGTTWHELYGGGFGYIISNNPLSNDAPRFYKYSAQIGNEHKSKKIYAQEINQYGLQQTIVY